MAFLLLVAACGSAGASSAPTAAATSPGAPGGTTGGAVYTVAVANGAIGAYLTGENGNTLYVFTADQANTTACTDACAAKWPPVVIDSGETVKAGDDVTGTLATFARPDGAMQVTINGLPLYYHAADTKAGDITGQGFGGKWFVADPAGSAAAPAASGAPKASAAPTKYGY